MHAAPHRLGGRHWIRGVYQGFAGGGVGHIQCRVFFLGATVSGGIFTGGPDAAYLLLFVTAATGLIVPGIGCVPGGLAAPFR